MTNGIHCIYSWYIDYAAITHARRSTRHILIRGGVKSIYSREMESSAFTDERLWRRRVHTIYSWEMEDTVFTDERWRPQHLHLRDGVHSIYSSGIVSTAYTNERCSQQNLRMRVQSSEFRTFTQENIFSLEMVYTAFNLERWNTQPIFMTDGFHSIYSWDI